MRSHVTTVIAVAVLSAAAVCVDASPGDPEATGDGPTTVEHDAATQFWFT